MALYAALLKGVGKGIVGCAVGGLAAEVLCEVLPEAARKVCEWWQGKRPEERRAEVEALAQAPPAEVKLHAAEIALELAPHDPAMQKQLSIYLSLVPGAIRASMRRPADPLGRTVPLAAIFDKPDSVLPLLPVHMPRFSAGDRPLPGIDWELDELLGAGGFGEVWKARNPHFDGVPPVALKFCLDPSAKDRLLRHEAAILNQVMRQGKHPGIVTLQHTYLSADPPCLEYEYVGGGDLSGMVNQWQTERADTARAARMVLDIARIVAFAHALTPAIVHRDLKPANVLIDADGKPRVADFGIGQVAAGRAIARSVRGVSQGAFLVTALRGAHTPMYASPQQMRGEAADPRDDVFALGVMWYQMLGGGLTTGRPGGTRWMGKLVAAGVPQAQVDLMSECLEDHPEDRPRDAGALAEKLAKLIEPAPLAKAEMILGKPIFAPAPPPAPPPAKEKPALLAAPMSAGKDAVLALEVSERCPDCDARMRVKANKHGGYFLGCGLFPTCRGTRRPPPELQERIKAILGGASLAEPPPPVKAAPVVKGHSPATVTNGIRMKLALVPAGSFMMGSPPGEAMRGDDEGPVRVVTIAQPFYLGVHPVTQREYEEVMGKNPSHFKKKEGGGPDHPVESVSWDEADEFCRKLARLDGKAAGAYFLPSEEQWEYACRAGTLTAFSFGNELSSEQANFDGNRPYGNAPVGEALGKTSKVGKYRANAWGLHDMHGNVWEWCGGWYAARTHRPVRGGSWNNSGHLCRSARRQKYPPGHKAETVGFRVAMLAG